MEPGEVRQRDHDLWRPHITSFLLTEQWPRSRCISETFVRSSSGWHEPDKIQHPRCFWRPTRKSDISTFPTISGHEAAFEELPTEYGGRWAGWWYEWRVEAADIQLVE